MHKKLWLCVLGFIVYLPFAEASTSPVGRWTTIDDKTGEKKADIELSMNHGKLYGTIVHRYMKPGDLSVVQLVPVNLKISRYKDFSLFGD